VDLDLFKGWVFDLDGVIWAGREPMPGAVALVKALRQAGRRVVFLTNNSGATAEGLAERLTAMGIEATGADVVTPMAAAGDFLRDQAGPVKVLVSGLPELVEALQAKGHTPVTDPEEAEAVVMGRDPDFTYKRLVQVCRAVDRGVPFLVLNRDVRYPVEGGGWLPGLGAWVVAVEAATGRESTVVGKPSPLLFTTALERIGTTPAESVMVGDTPAADIAGGRGAGLFTILVGGSKAPPAADREAENLAHVLRIWQGEA
jgi:HAD superfamily hydrolase (TIGR01450 family)